MCLSLSRPSCPPEETRTLSSRSLKVLTTGGVCTGYAALSGVKIGSGLFLCLCATALKQEGVAITTNFVTILLLLVLGCFVFSTAMQVSVIHTHTHTHTHLYKYTHVILGVFVVYPHFFIRNSVLLVSLESCVVWSCKSCSSQLSSASTC